MAPVSGHVFRYEGKRRPVWRAKYRLPDGRQVQKTIGPAWTRARPPAAGYFTKRTAEAWLRDVARAGARAARCPAWSAPASPFADACDEYLRYVEHDRDRKPSTLRDYRLDHPRRTCCRRSARCALEDITADAIEALEGARSTG